MNSNTPLITGNNNDDSDVRWNEQATSFQKAKARSPALLATLTLEMFVAFVFIQYSDTFNDYGLLIAFQPVISAVSGNVGLISSSMNTRAISHGLRDPNSKCLAILPDLKAGIWLGVFIGSIVGTISAFFHNDMCEEEDITVNNSIYFGIIIGIGQFISIMTAAISGAFAPMLFKFIGGTDPASAAGPLETAVQDIVGGTVLLAFSAWGLSNQPHCSLADI